jgi:hypothetical protein
MHRRAGGEFTQLPLPDRPRPPLWRSRQAGFRRGFPNHPVDHQYHRSKCRSAALCDSGFMGEVVEFNGPLPQIRPLLSDEIRLSPVPHLHNPTQNAYSKAQRSFANLRWLYLPCYKQKKPGMITSRRHFAAPPAGPSISGPVDHEAGALPHQRTWQRAGKAAPVLAGGRKKPTDARRTLAIAPTDPENKENKRESPVPIQSERKRLQVRIAGCL